MKQRTSDYLALATLLLALAIPVLLVACASQDDGVPQAAPSATSQPSDVAGVQASATEPPQATSQVVPTAGATLPAAQPAETQAEPPRAENLPATPAQTEGPYYRANPPQRASLLEPGMAGTRLTVTGQVVTPEGKPVPEARVDFWQADADGQYDNAGYRLRGYQLTDEQGRYTLETVVPGLYPGRTRHIHVKVQAPGAQELTTQLYFPGEPQNSSDRIFDPRLVMTVEDAQGGKAATFDFVLSVSS